MFWQKYLPESLVTLLIVALDWPTSQSTPYNGSDWTAQRKLAAREKTRELWYHGFDNYMIHAFPFDELAPLSCTGQGPDWANPTNIASNDVAGNFSLTLVDSLDTFIIIDDRPNFEKAVRNVIDSVSFDVNTKPQVFETTIRVLGGLLSAHIFANQSGGRFHLPWYHGELLDLAHDLGKRLLPAFSTPTGLPYARINLRHGMQRGESLETCTAGAGSLILEFATLSRLTGDERFEKAAYKAFFAIWNRKSDIGLVGNTINTWTGDWTYPQITGIGAGVDSFYEYALKWYIMSGETEFLDVWDDMYAAVMRYSRASDGFWYRNINIKTGDLAYHTIDSLAAFWPGVQVLAGDVQSAIKLHMMYYNIWRTHSGLPEVYDTNFKLATSHQYPLRPEFVESTWYLYRATKDPFYLDVGERILFDIITRSKVACGLCGIQDLRTNKRDDRMESFALSETLKYLFLLFDEENALHSDDSNYVFTTEGHILTLDRENLRTLSPARRKLRKIESHQCPAYEPQSYSGLIHGIRHRADIDYSRQLVALAPSASDEDVWSPDGWCEQPQAELFSYEFVLATPGTTAPEDLSPSLAKLAPLPDGYIIHNVTGIRTQVVRRFDGKGYDIRKLGHYTVRPGQMVYINDSSLWQSPSSGSGLRNPDVPLRFFFNDEDALLSDIAANTGFTQMDDSDILVTGFTSFFGADPTTTSFSNEQNGPASVSSFSIPGGVPLHREDDNMFGCVPFNGRYPGSALTVARGDCTFVQKLAHARDAGAVGVVVMSDEDLGINPTADPAELDDAGDLGDVALVVLPQTTARMVEEMVDIVEERGWGSVWVEVDHEETVQADQDRVGRRNVQPEDVVGDRSRVLYLNAHPLLNTRLLM